MRWRPSGRRSPERPEGGRGAAFRPDREDQEAVAAPARGLGVRIPRTPGRRRRDGGDGHPADRPDQRDRRGGEQDVSAPAAAPTVARSRASPLAGAISEWIAMGTSVESAMPAIHGCRPCAVSARLLDGRRRDGPGSEVHAMDRDGQRIAEDVEQDRADAKVRDPAEQRDRPRRDAAQPDQCDGRVVGGPVEQRVDHRRKTEEDQQRDEIAEVRPRAADRRRRIDQGDHRDDEDRRPHGAAGPPGAPAKRRSTCERERPPPPGKASSESFPSGGGQLREGVAKRNQTDLAQAKKRGASLLEHQNRAEPRLIAGPAPLRRRRADRV